MRPLMLTALAVMLLLPLASTARIVVVYSLSPGERPSVEDARKLVALLNDPATAADGAAFAESKRLGYKTAEGNAFTPGLAAPNGAYGYYWSDGPSVFVPGFKPAGGKFENPGSGLRAAREKAEPGRALARHADAFSARVHQHGLRVNYALNVGGPVEVALFGPHGRVLGRWTWTAAAGSHVRDLGFNVATAGGTVFLRYRVGAVQAVQRLNLSQSR